MLNYGGDIMKKFSEKVFLIINPPTEDNPTSIHHQLIQTLQQKGYPQVEIPLSVMQNLYTVCLDSNYQITVTLIYRESHWIITLVEAGNTRNFHYGLVVDYGSTTIIMQMIDMNSGKIIGQVQEMNGQIIYGTDILTRITYTMEHPSHMDDLQTVTVDTFERLMQQLTYTTGISAFDSSVMIISGNTTMIHFLLKLDARTVFFSPYAPVTLNPGWLWGHELRMNFSGMIYVIPAASNYVGGDIVSGLLNLNFLDSDEIKLFFDIGTNGELVIGNREWLMAGAGAAGPALEGYISKYGIRAQNGAVDTVKIQGTEMQTTTIGNKKAIGICGSGIIDLLAQMRLHGWINIAGELNPNASPRIMYMPAEEQYVVVYANKQESGRGVPLYFSQTDIHQYLDTKAAAFTMIDCLLDTAGCKEADISHCYLSGAFTAHSDLESAITIGIFPDLPREHYTCIANTSLDGARILLLDCTRLQDIHYYTETMYCVQFASIPDFLIRMQAAKFIPHTDMERFPNVLENLHNY